LSRAGEFNRKHIINISRMAFGGATKIQGERAIFGWVRSSGEGQLPPVNFKEECIMKGKILVLCTLIGALSLSAGNAMATDHQPAQEMPGTTQIQEQVYGSQLMTNDERNEYQDKMRAAKTAEEREYLRTQHHQSMQERAKARGMTLPDEPPARGGGMGMGPGGGGMMQGSGANR
jgi:hypothetical protein